MAVWLPAQNQFYLPPTPVTRIISTDDYVKRTSLFYYGSSERLLTVGHPYFSILNTTGNQVLVPKVSPHQYRVFRCRLPDPNKFAFGDSRIYDPEKERLVWACRGVEIGRGGPLGVSVTGNTLWSKLMDAENAFTTPNVKADYRRLPLAFDPKQTQLLIVGCRPALGEYWKKAKPCSADANTRDMAPPIEIESSIIQDGDMIDVGLGHLDFANLQQSKADAPMDIINTICKYPDFLQMTDDAYGDSMFFYARREALYCRHMFLHVGELGKEKVPEQLYAKQATSGATKPSDAYSAIPSGSLVSSETQLLNRPYWIQKSQGQNNGICWHNDLFLTVVDNTRGTNFTLTTAVTADKVQEEYKPANYYTFLRHAEEYQVSVILQLCKVPLTPETLAYIHTMDSTIVDEWHLNVAQPANSLHEQYRYLASKATKCPSEDKPVEPVDPYKNMQFWTVDLTDRLTADLDQTPLGRKFLFQNGLVENTSSARVTGARKRTLAASSIPTVSAKRRRK